MDLTLVSLSIKVFEFELELLCLLLVRALCLLCKILCLLLVRAPLSLVRAPLCLVCESFFGLHSVRNSKPAVDDIILRSWNSEDGTKAQLLR